MRKLISAMTAAVLLIQSTAGCVGDAKEREESQGEAIQVTPEGAPEEIREAQQKFEPFTLILTAILAGCAISAGLIAGGEKTWRMQPGRPDPFWGPGVDNGGYQPPFYHPQPETGR